LRYLVAGPWLPTKVVVFGALLPPGVDLLLKGETLDTHPLDGPVVLPGFQEEIRIPLPLKDLDPMGPIVDEIEDQVCSRSESSGELAEPSPCCLGALKTDERGVHRSSVAC